jgi:hypothetical protein
VADDIDVRGVELVHTFLDLVGPDPLVRGDKVTHLTASSRTPADLDMRIAAESKVSAMALARSETVVANNLGDRATADRH